MPGRQRGLREVGAGLDDGARHGAGAREAQVEKEVLPDSLEERQDADGLDIARLRNEQSALGHAHANNDQHAGKGEAQAREEQLRGAVVRGNTKEAVADLDAGEGGAPERAANETAQDESGQGGEIRLAAFHDVLLLYAQSKKEPATGGAGGGCCYPRGLYPMETY